MVRAPRSGYHGGMVRTRVPPGAIPQPVLELCRRFRAHGARAWVVGGCLRDLLLDREVSDWDLATSAEPDAVTRMFRRVIPTGTAHGTVTVLHRGEAFEVTTLRGEGAYADGRRPDSVHFVDDIEDDLARRDFTVNAMAYDPLEDRLVDPFGGLDDLRAGVLRAVGDPRRRFAEDGLRILRGARFVATLELELEPDTRAAFEGALDTFRKVSRERVREEWLKTMRARRPSRAFAVMRDTGILGVTFPALLEQVGCEQNRWHAYDVWEHTMRVLDESTGGPVERVAALLHDVAKPRTRAVSETTGDYTFYDHERVGAEMADRWLREYRFSKAEREVIVHLVRHHLVCYRPEWTDAAVRRFVRRVGEDHLDALLRLARADALGKGRDVSEELALLDALRDRVEGVLREGAALSTSDLAIDGRDVLERVGGRGGPVVGRVLRAVLERVVDDPSLNERARLLTLLDGLVPELLAEDAARRPGAPGETPAGGDEAKS